MKIFATGDTHGKFEWFHPEYFPEGGAVSHDTEDGILSLNDPNFERKYLTLKRKERRSITHS